MTRKETYIGITHTHKQNKTKHPPYTISPSLQSQHCFPTSDTFFGFVWQNKIKKTKQKQKNHQITLSTSVSLHLFGRAESVDNSSIKKKKVVSHTEKIEGPPQTPNEEKCFVHSDAALRYCCYFPGKVQINKSATLPFRRGLFLFFLKAWRV